MNTTINVRLYTYKSFRHYGGREITTTPNICPAILIESKNNTHIVELLKDCAGYKAGHKIGVLNKDYNI